MSVQYSDILNKVLFDQRDESWAEGELMMLRSEIEEFKRIVETVFSSHCPFGLNTLEFHLLHHFVEDLEWFEGIASTDARPSEHFNMLIK